MRARLDSLEVERQELERRLRAQLAAESDGWAEGPAASSSIVNGVYVGERSAVPERQLEILSRAVALATWRLALRGVDHDLSAGFGIGRLYVPLATDLALPEALAERLVGDCAEGREVVFPTADGSAERLADRERTRPLSAVECVCLRRSLTLLGEPGSGKSTVLAYVAHALATRNRAALPAWPRTEWPSLPVLLRLRDFAAWLARQGSELQAGDALVWSYVRHDLAERNLTFCLDALRSAIADGQAIMLWDGLDEIPAAALPLVRESLLDFRAKAPRCRYVATSRALAYHRPERRLPESDFPATALLPLDLERIDRFVSDWFCELGVWGHIRLAEAEGQGAAFRQELKRTQGLRLAGNPLQLTLMSLVYSQRRAVPEARARLFEETLDLLTARMDGLGPQGEGGAAEYSPGERTTTDLAVADQRIGDLLREARRDRCDLIGLCERLALAAQRLGGTLGDPVCPPCLPGSTDTLGSQSSTSSSTSSDLTLRAPQPAGAGIGESELLAAVQGLHPARDLDWAQLLVELIKQHPGLLCEIQPGVFDFPHRALREYLAGASLAHAPGFAQQAAALADDRIIWREPILHAVGFLVHCQRETARPLELMQRLCVSDSNPDDAGWRRIWLAGEVTLEVGYSRAGDSEGGSRTLERVRHRLAALVESGRLLPPERAAAGAVLGRLGDPRFEPRGFHLPVRYRGEREPALGLVPVNPGTFPMGSRAEGGGALPEELGNPRPIHLDYPYWISRYPVTVAQFRAFVKSRGYERRDWWTRRGWTWCSGQPRRAPEDWPRQRAEPNRPAVGVSWHEAAAFVRWLDASVRKRKTKIPDGYALRLPTEAEWELAARGHQGRIYPWGDALQEGCANCLGSLGTPSPVGLFPLGATPQGVYDLAGNVWEWTLSQDRPYPYNPHDGRNNPDADAPRILRGGSHESAPARLRAAARARAPQHATAGDIGFRFVLSLADSGV